MRKQEYSRAFCGAEQLALFSLLVYSKWKGSTTLFYIYWNSSRWSDSFSYHKASYIVIYWGEPSWFHSSVTCSHNQLVSRVHIDLDLLTLQVAHDSLTYICMWKGTLLMFTLAPDKKINPNICLFYILINEIFICPAWRQMTSFIKLNEAIAHTEYRVPSI